MAACVPPVPAVRAEAARGARVMSKAPTHDDLLETFTHLERILNNRQDWYRGGIIWGFRLMSRNLTAKGRRHALEEAYRIAGNAGLVPVRLAPWPQEREEPEPERPG